MGSVLVEPDDEILPTLQWSVSERTDAPIEWAPTAERTIMPVGQLVAVLPGIEEAMRAGQVYHLVGRIPPGLHHMQSGGLLGTLVDGNNKIAAQARFVKADAAPIAAGVAATFQIASAITLQYYLNEMVNRLDSIEAAVNRVMEFLTETALAEITNAYRASEDLATILVSTGTLEPHDLTRLVSALSDVSTAYLRDARLVDQFVELALDLDGRLDAAAATVGTTDTPKGLRTLKSDITDFGDALAGYLETADRMLVAAQVRARLLLIESAAERSTGPGRGAVVTEQVDATLREQGGEVARLLELAECFTDSAMDAISRLFFGEGKIRSVLDRFRTGVSQLLPRAGHLSRAFDESFLDPLAMVEMRPAGADAVEVVEIVA